MVAAPASYADLLPASVFLNLNGTYEEGIWDSSSIMDGQTIWSASASYDGADGSSVSATANGALLPSGSQYSVFAGAQVGYYIEVEPISANSYVGLVPVLFQANGTVTSTSTGTDFASDANIGVLIGSQQYILAACAQSPAATLSNPAPFGPCGLGSSGYGLDEDLPLQQNAAYLIDIFADGSAGSNGYITATLDPTIEIDPTWQYAADYEIVASPSVVPEPKSPWLLAGGLLVLLVTAIRRRRQPATGH
jgi:hypothetical protein